MCCHVADAQKSARAVLVAGVFLALVHGYVSSLTAASPVGATWIKEPTNPLVTGSGRGRGAPCVMDDGGTYKMWFCGDTPDRDIFYSSSADGVTWATPVVCLPRFTYAVREPWVIKDGGTYKMWFSAHNGGGYCGDTWIEYTESTSGECDWGAHTIVLERDPSSTYDNCQVYSPVVLKEGSEYKMWYAGHYDGDDSHHVGYATSPDGINWTRYAGNPVLSGDGSGFDADDVQPGGIFVENGVYYLLYTGWANASPNEARLGIAWSVDGINWTRLDSPILDLGAPGEFDDYSQGWGPLAGASMLRVGNGYWMWYTGVKQSGGSPQTAAIGLARGTVPETQMVRAESLADHGAAGELGLSISLAASRVRGCSITTESRAAGITKLRIVFSTGVTLPSPPEAAVESIIGVNNGDQTGKVTSVTGDGTPVMTISLVMLPDQDTYAVTIANAVTDLVGNPLGGDRDFNIRALHGEVNNANDDGPQIVNALDLSAIRQKFTADVTQGDNAKYDLVSDGVINALDLSRCRSCFTHTAP